MEKAAALAEKYSTQYSIKRDDSTDELLKSVHAQREARKKQLAEQTNRLNNNQESRESTPEHLKKYAGSANLESCATSSKRLRTFSETLKLLDDDILDELDVKWMNAYQAPSTKSYHKLYVWTEIFKWGT